MKKIAFTGSTGLIGSRIDELLSADFQLLPLLQSQIDITDREKTAHFLNSLDYDLLLHLAGYTNVDGAETDRELAQKINIDGTRNVFDATVGKGKQFVYISTDFVFDGKNPPYFEDSVPNPLSVYAQTKYAAEKIVANKGMIVRLSYPYRKEFVPKKDFVRNIRSLLQQGKTISMVTDATFTPTFIDDIANGLKYLMNNFSPEIYHLVGADSLSPSDAGKLIAKTYGLDASLIKPITYAEYYKNKAPRPQYSEIKSRKNNFQPMSLFEVGLKKML